VAFAQQTSPLTTLPQGEGDVVLKMGVSSREFRSEMAALKLFNGEGACRLLACNEERYWMLLERLNPGVMLATVEDDDEATCIAAEVMKKIWRPVGHVTLSGAKSVRNDDRDPSWREAPRKMTDISSFN